jgi:hypothetical protein
MSSKSKHFKVCHHYVKIENIPGILKKSEIVLVNKTKHNHQDILSLSESETR